MYRQHNNKS